MKKLLTILILLLTVASQGWAISFNTKANEVVISNTETVMASDWSSHLQISTDKFTTAKAGDIITVYFKDNNSGTIKHQSNGAFVEESIGSNSSGKHEYTLTSDNITNLNSNGLDVGGANYTVEYVSLTHTAIEVYKGPTVVDWGGSGEQPDIDASKFANLQLNDFIRLDVSGTSGDTQYNIRKKTAGGNYSETTEYQVTTEEALTDIKTNGIYISGCNFTLETVTIENPPSSLMAGECRTLFSGTQETTWTKVCEKNASWGGLLAPGDQIKITVSDVPVADYHYVWITNSSGTAIDEGNAKPAVTAANTTYIISLTSDEVTAMRSGFAIWGQNVTVTKVELYKPLYALTTTATNGSISVKNGNNDENNRRFETVTNLTLTATAADYYSFSGWTVNGSDAGSNLTLNLSMDADKNVVATFAVSEMTSGETRTLFSGTQETTWTKVCEKDASWGALLAEGDQIKITVSAINGEEYHYVWLTDNSGTDTAIDDENAKPAVSEANTYIITLTADEVTKMSNGFAIWGQNVTVTKVELYRPVYMLTITQATGGTIKNGESAAATGTHAYGTEITLTAVADDNYEFSKWSDGTNDLVAETDGSLIVTMDGDKSVTAVFLPVKTLSSGSTKINGSTSVVIHKAMFANASVGDKIIINISSISTASGKENPGYAIKGANEDETENSTYNWAWIEGGNLATDATTIIRTITSDDLAILKASGLSIEGDGIYICGNVTLATNGSVPTAQTHSNPNYTLTVNTPVGGSVTIKKGDDTVSAGEFELDTELTLTATANDGYVFNKWTKDGTALEDTSNPLTITMTADVTMAAIFKSTPLVNEDRRTLWENASGQALDWNLMFDQTSAVGEIVETGEILIFTVKEVGANPKIWLMSNDGNTTLATLDPLIVGENRLSITADMKTAMEEGFKFKGGDATITKIELYKPTPITALAEEEMRTLWSNTSGTALSWNTIAIERAAEWGAVLEEDERIIISVKAKEAGDDVWPTVQLQNDTEKIASTANLLNDLTVPCDITITLTSEMVNKMKNGFSITGDKATITKAVLYKPTMPTKTVHTLNSTETAISGETNVTVTAEKFANIAAYDVLTVNFTITTSPANVIIKGNGEDGGWDYLKEMKFENGETLFALPLTPAMTSNLKKNGLQITGSGYTFKSVTIKTAGEVPSDEEKKDDEKKDDEETIIDEKTGETDLSELTAQDDTKTTLTQNEDGSITMTTTEAYQAAQIWFNDPEPVAGNVLKVELAESSVNVTVTVKYTDGTESQMSANTMVAKARGETRSASGTTVEVPLESGKEVQNIEVKNNVAGTITIKKMQVTTVNVFTNGVANLSMLKPQSNATYDTAAHTLATTKGWTGATISPVANENVSGKELLIEFADASKVKVAVKYRTDVEGPSTIMEKAAKAVRLALDNTKNIQEISIQPTEAAIVTFTKIAVNSEETDDGSLKPGKTITLWENAAGETLAWNEVAKQDASVGETLKEYDELLITVSGVTKGCDWPKVFIRDASSEQAGNEVLLNDIGSFPYTVRIVLTGEMAQQLSKGFSICGDGVTVTKLQVYRPEAPKPGDIHLADLNYGYNSSYDKGTHTITTTARWAARGWEIGDKRYNDKNLITVKFEPVDFPVTLKMEYTTGLQTAQATSVGVPAGRTELLLEIPSGISKLNRVYIIYENPGSVKLTEASVTYQDNLKLSTAIRSFEADGVIRDGRYDTDGWYNLRGMRIPEPKTSGVYIHGGKKVVIY